MMGKYKVIPVGRVKDLRGQKFGRLTVVDRVEKPEGHKSAGAYWICKCECGEESVVLGANLTAGHTASCGCLRAELVTKDLTGRVFGQLKVVRASGGRSGSGCLILECVCACGKTAFVRTDRLVAGITRSCGHLVSDGEEFRTRAKQLDQKLSRNSTSGHKGVTWSKSNKKWKAQIVFRGKNIYLGYFADIQDAIQARKEAEDYYFKPVLEHFEDRR